MDSNYKLLSELIEKAVLITLESLKCADNNDFIKLDELILKREKIVNIILTLSERMDLGQQGMIKNNLHATNEEITKREKAIAFNNQVNLLLNKINELDEKLMLKLGEEKNKTQIEIAKAFKNKENLKGYNLNCLK